MVRLKDSIFEATNIEGAMAEFVRSPLERLLNVPHMTYECRSARARDDTCLQPI